MDVKQLMAAAEASMIALDVEQAAKFYFQARAQVTEIPVRLQILEKLGQCHVSILNQDKARQYFQEALRLHNQPR